MNNNHSTRRGFLKTAAALTGATTGLSILPAARNSAEIGAIRQSGIPAEPYAPFRTGGDDHNIIGPKDGYSPQIGTLVSMMAWIRPQIVATVKGMTTEQLDFLLDAKANTIGALLYHLCATDAFYHEHTFKGVPWGGFDPDVQKKFGAAMQLGDIGRSTIKGNNLDFYLNLLQQTREDTLQEFKKRDDAWFMTVDEKWFWGPTNNYCKWFHVCEHESHHLGQIALLKSRVPGISTGNMG